MIGSGADNEFSSERERPGLKLKDGALKVTGGTTYAGDLKLPDVLHARLVLSPYPHARIINIDTRRAQSLRGVVTVLTGHDLQGAAHAPSSRSHALLAIDRVVFLGQPVAVVLAQDTAVAEDAATLVNVSYEPLPAAVDPFRAMDPAAPLVWPTRVVFESAEAAVHGAEVHGASSDELKDRPGNVSAVVHFRRGNVAAGFREADVVLERTYRSSAVHQGYIEPHATAASFDPVTGEVTIWTGTQGTFWVRTDVAQVLRIPEARIRVVPMAVGGGFGGKIVLLEPLVAAIAMQVRRSVLLVLSRREEFLVATPAPQGVFELKMGATKDGRMTALQARVVFDSGAFPGSPMTLACLVTGWAYKWPHLDIEGIEVLTHKAAAGAYRAPGAPPAVFAAESHVDELARALGLDPIEFRLRNLIGGGDSRPDGEVWPPLGLRTCLERLQRHPVWQSRQRQPYEGYGIALSPWRGAIEPAAALCRLEGDGTIVVTVGAVDISGSHTSLAVIAAEAFGVSADAVRVICADTDIAPFAGVSGGSKTTYTVGLAVQQAAAEARQQLLAIAAQMMESHVRDLEIVGNDIRVRGVPERQTPISAIVTMVTQPGSRYAPILGRGLTVPTDRASGSSVHLAHVAVDAETGHVRILDYVAVQDVGFAINPPAVKGQIHGGVAQGIGWGLLESIAYDEHGHVLTQSLADYAMPSSLQVPSVQVELVEVPLQHTPFGARGVGEPPVVPVAAAIANAICDATGVRCSQIPVTPSMLWRAMEHQKDEAQ